MPEYLLLNSEKISDSEHALLEGTLTWWFDVLDMNPVLLLGEHRPTGGMLVLPFQRNNLSTDAVVKLLEGAIAYLKRAAAEQ